MSIELFPLQLAFRGLSDEPDEDVALDPPTDLDDDEEDDLDDDEKADEADDAAQPEE